MEHELIIEAGRRERTWSRFQRAIRNHGWFGTARLAVKRIAWLIGLTTLARLWVRMGARYSGWRFDQRHAVDTAGWIEPSDLGSSSDNLRSSCPYGGVLPSAFRGVLGQLPIDYRNSVFTDFGSGKGRALLLASEWPFQKIVGVDFSPALCRIAIANKKKAQNLVRACPSIEVVCSDAVAFPICPQPAVFFLFNPFGEPVMSRIAAKIGRSLQQWPRDVWVIYFFASAAKCWDELTTLERYCVRQPAWGWPVNCKSEVVAVWRSKEKRSITG